MSLTSVVKGPKPMACAGWLVLFISLASAALSAEVRELETYIRSFDYAARIEMKISSKELVPLLRSGQAQLVDIRFPEEVAAWRVGFSTNIPLPELPDRLGELDRDKLIVTACPHKDRSGIARVYLETQRFRAKYLEDGLLGLVEHLRGDRAREFVQGMEVDAKSPVR